MSLTPGFSYKKEFCHGYQYINVQVSSKFIKHRRSSLSSSFANVFVEFLPPQKKTMLNTGGVTFK